MLIVLNKLKLIETSSEQCLYLTDGGSVHVGMAVRRTSGHVQLLLQQHGPRTPLQRGREYRQRPVQRGRMYNRLDMRTPLEADLQHGQV